MSVAELVGFADEALAGLAHRAGRLRPRRRGGAAAGGLRGARLADLTTAVDAPRDRAAARARHRRRDRRLRGRPGAARRLAARGGLSRLRPRRLPGARPGGSPRRATCRCSPCARTASTIAFAHIEHVGDGAEITQVYVDPRYRGDGRGTALTRAAIVAAGGVQDLWICADDEDRPKELYARLGFRPALTTMEFLRMPPEAPGDRPAAASEDARISFPGGARRATSRQTSSLSIGRAQRVDERARQRRRPGVAMRLDLAEQLREAVVQRPRAALDEPVGVEQQRAAGRRARRALRTRALAGAVARRAAASARPTRAPAARRAPRRPAAGGRRTRTARAPDASCSRA